MSRPIARARPAERDSVALTIGVSIGLIAVVLLLYAQTAGFEFISLDDQEFITQNPPVRAGLTLDGAVWSLTALQPNWHPVTWWTHMLDVELFGLAAGRHHLTSVAFHAAASVLFFLAFHRMTRAPWPSALAAALFAVHPLRAESVAWLAERKDVVSGTFWMLTLLAYAAYVRRPGAVRYLAVALALGLGLMSKTMLVSLPLILLLLDYWPLNRLAIHADGDRARRAALAARLVVEKLPLLALSVAASLITVRTQQAVSGVKSIEDVPLAWRIVNAPLAYVRYLAKTVWPADLGAFYPHPALIGAPLDDASWTALLAAAALVAVTAWALTRVGRRPYLAVGWLWYLIALLPVIGLVQTGMQAFADRYTYLSMPGLYVAAAWSLRDLVAARPRLRLPVAAGAAAAVGALATAAWFQIATWRDSATVFEQALAVTEDNYLIHASYGAVLRSEGRFDQAERHLREALRIRPAEPFTRMQLGTLLQDQGRLDEAAAQHLEALRLNPAYAQAHGNLGVVRLRQERLAEAEAHLRTALRLEPGYALAYSNLGAALLKQGRWAEAAPSLERAVALDPTSADAHNNLGVALVQLGRLPEAKRQFETALRLRPGHANATRSLEYVRGQIGP